MLPSQSYLDPKNVRTILLTIIALLALNACSPDPWEPMQLSESSRQDPTCQQEIGRAMETLIARQLTGVTLRENHIQELIEAGTLTQPIRLYGTDQRWDWTLASFHDGDCSVYNTAQTKIDVISQRENTRKRPIRGTSGLEAKIDLRNCTCVPILTD